MKVPFLLVGVSLIVLIAAGCTSPRTTNTARSAVEQMLLTEAIERGIRAVNFNKYRGKKVFLEYDYLAPQVDKPYIQGYLELHLARHGVLVTRKADQSELTLQVICGVLATDFDKVLFGTPTLPIPLPYTDLTFAIPEIPLYEKITRQGFGRFSFNMVKTADRAPVEVIDGINTNTYQHNWKIFWVPFTTYDVDKKPTVNVESHVEFF
ncbi:MAG: hypothetical protein PHS41_08275 [Victivallaceae bacterium]|nr:hypothetical protein [Victivallaceae bacterium]